jgi:hypothetical protein
MPSQPGKLIHGRSTPEPCMATGRAPGDARRLQTAARSDTASLAGAAPGASTETPAGFGCCSLKRPSASGGGRTFAFGDLYARMRVPMVTSCGEV